MSARDRHHRDTGPLDPQRASVLVEHVCLDPSGTPARTLVLAAHPDDEVIGASWLLTQLSEVHVLHVTDGTPLAGAAWRAVGGRTALESAGIRRAELLEAMAVAGIPPSSCARLGLTEGEAWRDLDTLVWGVVDAFMTWAPDLLLTHAYEGGHPDHDAAAFAAQAAVRVLSRMHLPVPALAEFTSYHRGDDGGLVTGEFLPDPQPVFAVELGPDDRRRKRAMLRAFASRKRVLDTFTVDHEYYRAAPRYDFTRAPHAGPLFYETQPCSVTGGQWRAAAAATLAHRSARRRRVIGRAWDARRPPRAPCVATAWPRSPRRGCASCTRPRAARRASTVKEADATGHVSCRWQFTCTLGVRRWRHAQP
jgi:LmbE family N-acetylglucosaminyl deacetylase